MKEVPPAAVHALELRNRTFTYPPMQISRATVPLPPDDARVMSFTGETRPKIPLLSLSATVKATVSVTKVVTLPA
jgi:hypothetical protein